MTGWGFNDLALVPHNKQRRGQGCSLSFRITSNKMTKSILDSNFVHFLLVSLFSMIGTFRLGICIMYVSLCVLSYHCFYSLFIMVKSLSLTQGKLLETMPADTKVAGCTFGKWSG